MILILLALGAGVLTTVLAAMFGDVSFQYALNLSFGLVALAVGLAIVRFQILHRHHAVQSHATQSARQFAQDATPSWHVIAGSSLAIAGALDVLWSLRTLVGA